MAHGPDMDELLRDWLRTTAELTSTVVNNAIINHIWVNQLPVFAQLAFSSVCSFSVKLGYFTLYNGTQRTPNLLD